MTQVAAEQMGRRELYGTAPPTLGAFILGDKLWNTAPEFGAAIGWVCTTAGSPGTWEPFGIIIEDPILPSIDDPTEITGLIGWYDFSDISVLWQDTARTSAVTTDGQSIAGVTDQSGQGNHLSQATAGQRPLYQTNVQNSLSVSEYDDSAVLTAVLTALDDSYAASFFAVIRNTVIGAHNDYWFGYGTHSTAGAINSRRISDTINTAFLGTAEVAVSTSVTYPDSTGFIVLSVVGNLAAVDNSAKAWKDGTAGTWDGEGPNYEEDPETPIDTFQDGGTMSIGGFNSSWIGEIAEFCLYDTALANPDVNQVTRYLGNKWNISVATIA